MIDSRPKCFENHGKQLNLSIEKYKRETIDESILVLKWIFLLVGNEIIDNLRYIHCSITN